MIRELGQPGDLGWVIKAHGEIYTREFGWNGEFEALVARIVADYANSRDPRRENAWIAEVDGARAGCVFCVDARDSAPDGSGPDGSGPGDGGTAVLRILLVDPARRGHGLGAQLVDACLAFARAAGYRQVRLWTNDILTAARKIYLERGFDLVDEAPHHSFGVDLVGQTYRVTL